MISEKRPKSGARLSSRNTITTASDVAKKHEIMYNHV